MVSVLRRYGIEKFVPHILLRKNSYPEYYNREVKRLNIKSEST
jgi:hypothetical protein